MFSVFRSLFFILHFLQVLPRLFRLYTQCLAKPFFRFLPVTFQIGQHTEIIPCTRVIGHLTEILPCANRIACHDYRRSRIDIGQHVVRKVVGGYLINFTVLLRAGAIECGYSVYLLQ